MSEPLVLLRIARRNTTFEEGNLNEISIDEIIKVEFPDALDGLSVYEIPDEQRTIVQTYCEHYASHMEPPVRARKHFNVEGLHPGRVRATPGNTQFPFSRAAHREISFGEADEVRAFVRHLIRDLDDRARSVTRDEARCHIRDQVAQGDEAWIRLCASTPKWRREVGLPDSP